jgi:hypothetical protein
MNYSAEIADLMESAHALRQKANAHKQQFGRDREWRTMHWEVAAVRPD